MDEYFVGAYKKKSYTKWDEPIYDEIFKTNSYQEAWEFALKWNLRGYTVELQTAEDDVIVNEQTYKPYEMEKFNFSIDEAYAGAPASLMTVKNQLMSLLGDDFRATGGGTVPKITVYSETQPEKQFEITTDNTGKGVDITPKIDGVPDTLHKKRGIAYMRAAKVLYDYIMTNIGYKRESRQRPLKLKIEE